MPTIQVGVTPDGHREAFFAGAAPGADAEFGDDEVADKAGIEVVAGDSEQLPLSGAEKEEREITCAAAEVADEEEFLLLEPGDVEPAGGDGPHPEVDGFETVEVGGLAEAGEAEGAVFGFGANVADGAAGVDSADMLGEERFGLSADFAEESGDPLFGAVLSADNLGAFQGAAGNKGG